MDMTDPTELYSDDECFNTRYFTSLQHLCIGYLILPYDAGYVTQAAHMKLISRSTSIDGHSDVRRSTFQ